MQITEPDTSSLATSPLTQDEIDELAADCLTTALIRGYAGAAALDDALLAAGVFLPLFRRLPVREGDVVVTRPGALSLVPGAPTAAATQ